MTVTIKIFAKTFYNKPLLGEPNWFEGDDVEFVFVGVDSVLVTNCKKLKKILRKLVSYESDEITDYKYIRHIIIDEECIKLNTNTLEQEIINQK